MWDKRTVMYNDQNCFASGADNDSGDTLDFQVVKSSIGDDGKVRWKVMLTAAVTGGTSIQPVLCDSVDGSTWVKKLFGPIVPVAEAVAGKVLVDVPVPDGIEMKTKTVFTNVGANAAGKANARFY